MNLKIKRRERKDVLFLSMIFHYKHIEAEKMYIINPIQSFESHENERMATQILILFMFS
jgi:hypothetical protein